MTSVYMITKLNRKRKGITYRRKGEGIPRIPEAIRKAPKAIASRYFQLAPGHAMIAPFLKEKFKWVDSDLCWWCTKNRQSREHLFKECSTWKEEIRQLWKEVAEATEDKVSNDKRTVVKRKGGKGFRVGFKAGERKGGRRPGNTSAGVLMADERCIPAVLSFLSSTRCGLVKEGILAERGAP